VNAAASTFGLYGIRITDGNFALLNNKITISQTNDSAVYAIWNTAVNTSKYIENTLTIDQDSVGAHMLSGFNHHAGAGSIMYCLENTLIIDSTHTAAGIGYGIYASAEWNYVNDNIIDADASGTGEMYGLYTGTAKTAEYTGNTVEVTTGDGDGEWANFGVGTSYVNGNTITGDGLMGTGGTIYADRQANTLALTTDTVLTLPQLQTSYTISNQGAGGEVDLTWPVPPTYTICNRVYVSENQVMECGPNAGGIVYLDGTPLDADDCVDTDAATGNFHFVCSGQRDDGTWGWDFSSHTGSFLDTDATD